MYNKKAFLTDLMAFSRFQRMVGIPEDEYTHLKSLQQATDPVQKKFLSLSHEYQREGFIKNPHVRVQKQGETLNEMINMKEELRNRLVQATPKPYRTRAESLFQYVANKISTNERGEMIDVDGDLIDGSNISDLIQHAVRDRRRNIIPSGWNNFLKVLKDTNAPRMILNYDTLNEINGNQSAVAMKAKKLKSPSPSLLSTIKKESKSPPKAARGRPRMKSKTPSATKQTLKRQAKVAANQYLKSTGKYFS